MKEYVLQFLSQHEEEHGCTRSFKASFWSRGVEVPCITHHVFGSNSHLSSIESKEPKSPAQDENLENSS
ncbi:hypothetical protein Fmac_020651 [Flemingia macrophylla]|uniref:Uncharacterized protein n=1 Tax=Flemingia macrophylla TaxID=520843 RepID=A0ABD1LUN6_9FABA